VKRDDGINDGKIRMFATLESRKGNACDTLDRETKAYTVEKGESGPLISISVLSYGGAALCQQGLDAVGQFLHAVALADHCVRGNPSAWERSRDRVGIHGE